MSDNATEVPTVTVDFKPLTLPILTGEWITWNEEQATAFSTQVRAAVKLVGILRQRHDEQLDQAQAVGKFPKMERIRKARSDDDGPKVDPLAEALAAFGA